MVLQNYLRASRSLSKFVSLGDMRESTANSRIVSKLLDISCDSESTVDQIYSSALAAIAPSKPLILVRGGSLPKKSRFSGAKVIDFELGKFPVTVEEWNWVQKWALANHFDIQVGVHGAPQNPAAGISWYDCVLWCNAKSVLEGLDPAYKLKDGKDFYVIGEFKDDGEESLVLLPDADGYRLPSQAEWEWAARGGSNSQHYTFAGSNTLHEVGWYLETSNGSPHCVGEKMPNELGLHDMSGNVLEWCWDKITDSIRTLCGGSWKSNASECDINHRFFVDPSDRNINNGFRLARSL
jgi:sulfatase modifying factor 1